MTHPLRVKLLIALALLTLSVGCHRLPKWQFGYPTFPPSNVQSVHVYMFESDSYRRFLGQRMTEMVVKEIESQTPMRISSAEAADSFVRGKILFDRKRALSESINDDPRDLLIGLRVEVTWVDRFGVPLMERQVLRLDDDVNFIPEGGQSMSTAQQELINKIARQIVQQMEPPW